MAIQGPAMEYLALQGGEKPAREQALAGMAAPGSSRISMQIGQLGPSVTPVRYAIDPWIATVFQGYTDSFEGETLTHRSLRSRSRSPVVVRKSVSTCPI